MEKFNSPIHLPPLAGNTLINLGVTALIVIALYFGREVLVPIALAVLFSFVLAPLVLKLQSWRIPRTLAVVAVVFIGFAVMLSLGALMVSQAARLADDLPGYQQTLREKIQGLRGVAAGGSETLERASKVLKELNTELQNPSLGSSNGDELRRLPSERPIPVEVRQPDPGTLSTLVAIIQPLVQPLTTTGVVFIFVIFILLQRQDLRNRFIRLAGSNDIQRTTAALDDAGERLSRLFLTQSVVNAAFGFLVGLGLHFVGVPSAPLWGLVAATLRFVPYVGTPISAVFPLILAAAVGTGWQMLALTASLFVTLQIITGQIIEPQIFGRSSGLSPVAIVVSASFWTWLWGPIGLVLATPLTVCLVVIGRHVDRLKFFDVLFGDQPVLTPSQLVYQRLLAGDPVEALQQAQTHLASSNLQDYYDAILLEGLRLAERDALASRLDDERLNRILSTISEILEELEGHRDTSAVAVEPLSSTPLTKIDSLSQEQLNIGERWKSPRAVLCIPGASKLDEAAAAVIAQILRRRGIGAFTETADSLSISKFFSLDMSDTQLFCLCYVDNPSNAKIQYAVRRLQRKVLKEKVVVALLGGGDGHDTLSIIEGAILIPGNFADVIQGISEQASR